MNKTKIDWCTHTVNPVVGCTFGCEYCYARKLNDRFKWIEDWSKPQFYPERLKKLSSKKPKIIFMNSMSDIADWKDEWIEEVFWAIEENPQHIYLFLTKRPDIYIDMYEKGLIPCSPNIWLGTTLTTPDDEFVWFRDIPQKSFVSIEPILEPFGELVSKDYFVDWVIVGAETGNRKDKVIPEKDWIIDIKNQCIELGIPIFMKESLEELMGQDFIQEFPWDRSD